MKHRILLILPLNGGSLIVSRHVANAMSSMREIDLKILETQPLLDHLERNAAHIFDETRRRKTILENLNLEAMRHVADFKPDVVLVMALAPIIPWFLESAGQSGAVTAHWYIENSRYYPANPLIPPWQVIAPYYDHFFTIQKGAFFKALASKGVKNYHYLPVGCNPWIHNKIRDKSSLNRNYCSEICFVASPYPNRVNLLKDLHGFDIALWGPGWAEIEHLRHLARGNGSLVTSREENLIINGAKIGLNIHSTLDSEDSITQSDFLNPRVFTIAACGTFQLVDEHELLADIFQNGKEVATYHDPASLKSQITYFMKNREDRERMARNASERVLAEHTYQHRIHRLLQLI